MDRKNFLRIKRKSKYVMAFLLAFVLICSMCLPRAMAYATETEPSSTESVTESQTGEETTGSTESTTAEGTTQIENTTEESTTTVETTASESQSGETTETETTGEGTTEGSLITNDFTSGVTTAQSYRNQTYARPGSGSTATSGTSDHIEIEIAGSASFVIPGNGVEEAQTITTAVTITIEDQFEVEAYTLDENGNQVPYTGFTYEKNTVGNGSTQGSTVDLQGSYPTGTKDSPVYYVVTLVKDVTFELNDGSTLTVPVTLKVTTHYWDEGNHCPGIGNNKTQWQNGYYISRSGIDVPISGETVGQAITEGKVAIQKLIYGDETDVTPFTFVIQSHGTGAYLTFDENACTGTSAALTDACYIRVNGGSTVVLTEIPVGIYRITEIQKDGYIITDVDGNEASNYTLDYIVENKEDSNLPIATFTNKKLTNEAGISIKKVASGLTSGTTYPNPTVSIYALGTDGNKTGNALWTGTLTANGDTLYLTTTLPAGTYIMEETAYAVEGYGCTTTLAGGETVDGLKFTVLGGNRYDFPVSNVYQSNKDVTITKIVSGSMGDTTKTFTFEAKLVLADGTEQMLDEFSLMHNASTTIPNIPVNATLYIRETNADKYTVTVTVNGTEVNVEPTGWYPIPITASGTLLVEVNNYKDVMVDTGIFLDSLPYIMLLSIVMVGGFLLFIHKRRSITTQKF